MKKITELFLHDGGLKNINPPKYKLRFNYILLFIFLGGILIFSFNRLNYTPRWIVLYTYRSKFITGFIMTLGISFASLVLSLILGSFFAFSRNSRLLLLKYLSKVYVEVIRGTPLLVQYLFFLIGTAFNVETVFNGIIFLSVF